MATVGGEPSRREAKRAAHLAALLDSAEEVFARKGYQDAAVSDIASAAGLAVGTVYRFFSGKRELASAVMERIAAGRVEGLRAVALPAAAYRADGLAAMVRLRVRHHVLHGAFLRMGFEMQRSLGRREPPERIRALFDETRRLSSEFFASGVRLGFWRDVSPERLARAFDGICNEEIFWWERSGRPVGEETFAADLAATLEALFSK